MRDMLSSYWDSLRSERTENSSSEDIAACEIDRCSAWRARKVGIELLGGLWMGRSGLMDG